MFKKILVAYDESPESGRALLTAIHLAKGLNAELRAVSVQENLPPYAGYIDAEVPGGTILFYCVSRPPITIETCRPVRNRPLSGKA